MRMPRLRRIQFYCLVSVLTASGLCACTKTAQQNEAVKTKKVSAETENEDEAKESTSGETAKPSLVVCESPQGVGNRPTTISDFIKFVNALPRPVSVACVIDALAGPFRLNATSNVFSGQPANSQEYPRIFLFFGSTLTVSVVPKGEGSQVIELGYKIDTERTVKGELHFPVTEILAEDSAYTPILESSGQSTLCRICHAQEGAAPAGFPTSAFASRRLAADPYYNVTLEKLKESAENCGNRTSDECLLLKLIFQKEVVAESF